METTFQPTGTFNNLGVNSYTVIVRDANGCTQTSTAASVVEATGPNAGTPSATPTACASNTGTVSITASGGAAPYEYSIDGTTFQPTGTFNNLGVNSYTVIVRDANSCIQTSTAASVVEATGLNAGTPSATPTACASNTGTVSMAASGGAAPYEYSIDGTTFQPTGNFTGLGVNSYTVIVRDANGCTQTSTAASVVEATGPNAGTPSSTPTACASNTGTVSITGSGGAAPYEYSIDGTTFQPTGNL